jgi:hypothetical protein
LDDLFTSEENRQQVGEKTDITLDQEGKKIQHFDHYQST